MTTPQQQPEAFESTEGTGASAQNVDAAGAAGSSYETHHAADRTHPTSQRATERPDQSADSSTRGPESSAQQTSTGPTESLFGDRDHSNLRSRWADVQAAFVDDPRECVQKADRLVADLVDQLTASFAEARSKLEEQWARGEEVSTENLRVALKRYREFFERLLSVQGEPQSHRDRPQGS